MGMFKMVVDPHARVTATRSKLRRPPHRVPVMTLVPTEADCHAIEDSDAIVLVAYEDRVYVVDGNHRLEGVLASFEEFVRAWLLKEGDQGLLCGTLTSELSRWKAGEITLEDLGRRAREAAVKAGTVEEKKSG